MMDGSTLDGAARAASRIAHGLSADLLQLFPGGVFLQLGYGLGLERGGGASYLTHSAVAELGWRR